MAVSRTFAEFYFGDQDPVGQVIKSGEFEAQGVVIDFLRRHRLPAIIAI